MHADGKAPSVRAVSRVGRALCPGRAHGGTSGAAERSLCPWQQRPRPPGGAAARGERLRPARPGSGSGEPGGAKGGSARRAPASAWARRAPGHSRRCPWTRRVPGNKGRLGPPGSGQRPAERLSPPCPGTQRLSPPCSGEWPVRRLTRAAPGRGQRSGWAGPRAEHTDSSVSAGLPLGFPVPYSTSDVLCDSNLGGRALNEIWYWEYSIRLSPKFSTQIWVFWNAAF